MESIFYTPCTLTSISTPYGVIPRDDLMILSLKDLTRIPPLLVMQQLLALNDKHQFGDSLRRCTQPDFISRAILGESNCYDSQHLSRTAVEKSSSWLLPAISVDLDSILNRVPLSAAGHLFLMTCLRILQRFSRVGFVAIDPQLIHEYKEMASMKVQKTIEQMDMTRLRSETIRSIFQMEDYILDAKLLSSLAQKV
jgi:hypothetical protein